MAVIFCNPFHLYPHKTVEYPCNPVWGYGGMHTSGYEDHTGLSGFGSLIPKFSVILLWLNFTLYLFKIT